LQPQPQPDGQLQVPECPQEQSRIFRRLPSA